MEVIGFSQVITMMGSFLVVILLLAVTLFGIKKYSAVMGISGEQRLELLEVKNLGGRQKLVLVGVNGEQLLIGVSPHSLTHLGTWDRNTCVSKSREETTNKQMSRDKISQHAKGFGALFTKAKTEIKD
jgi:flagellar protein FliO/FliZ|tara:strand:- start:811 stop:1194 length:384 start_codon:yes stop_codon:yes gene_type:complete